MSEHARIDEAVAAATAAAAGLTGAEAEARAPHAGLLYDYGLAWVNFPRGAGGLGVSASLQDYADAAVDAAGLHRPDPHDNAIGFGMAAPTIAAYGTAEQKTWLRRIYTLETIVCQLFSEPGAGSDLAAVATKAVRDGDTYRVTGQKVWTSGAHNADLAILIARTDPSVPKHRGLSYFLLDMHAPGVETRGLRQITGEAEFNEVFLTDVPVPASMRLGEPGEGWKIANTTLNNERVAIGGGAPREGGMLGVVTRAWREQPEVRDPLLHDELMRLWVESEAARMLGERTAQQVAAGQPGPEGSGAKLSFARNAQQLSALDVRMRGVDGLRHDSYEMRRPEHYSMTGRTPVYRYLRAKGNSIEGGTSEIIRNIIAERVLGLPGEHRTDKDLPFKDLPR
ncbi:acyl-CoA dehydrogenase family protein [Brevibacterium sp. p3-SID960]|uniref:acyl-CoA dehydrogenase family protein n=1 Tax=Brevibacterium sp. p3-SID960 TaxID=2916063 RepID=UPI0021A6B6C7|nr:acyl-CoA dehydrogenase family protein [Brevibacterium sp. p3-SID960]MCT1690684.1 acyl-CoA dehydrogenase family protein [Brevibacterium sp. p3-SID960]